jgi:hypothetical protein
MENTDMHTTQQTEKKEPTKAALGRLHKATGALTAALQDVINEFSDTPEDNRELVLAELALEGLKDRTVNAYRMLRGRYSRGQELYNAQRLVDTGVLAATVLCFGLINFSPTVSEDVKTWLAAVNPEENTDVADLRPLLRAFITAGAECGVELPHAAQLLAKLQVN